MRRRSYGLALCVAMVLVGLIGAPALASAPIGPNQHFVGLVNGKPANATVKTVCPGPATRGRTGAVLGGQTVSVRRSPRGSGFTAGFTQVNVWFVPRQPQPAPVQFSVQQYGKPVAIPTSIRVPCSGTGTVEFSSCPYLAPCAYGWVPTYVKVRFVNVAA